MEISVRPVVAAENRKAFIRLPYSLNAGIDRWVPPLLISQEEMLSAHHSFWKRNPNIFYLAYKGDRLVGRIVAFINTDHSRHFGTSDGFFGFLDAVDDDQVFDVLLKHAEKFLRSHGCRNMIGPMNPTIHHELGVLTRGFDLPPYFMLTFNAGYYDEHIRKSGWAKLKDFCAYELGASGFRLTNKIQRIALQLQQRHSIAIRKPDLNNFMNELRIFHEIYNNAFVDHWGFAPISWEDFQLLGKDMKMLLDRNVVLIAEIENKPVGFLLAIPNLNEALIKLKNGRLLPFGFLKLFHLKRKIRTLRVITVAIRKEYQHLGIGSILYPELFRQAMARHYQTAELSWVVEDNVKMNKMCREVGGIETKNYRLYSKVIAATD
jgi:GNAT superfamily N-acetyltransferase